ncbi:MAG: hypothetical protein ACI82F_002599, partial [Planctomycetota bacterium]
TGQTTGQTTGNTPHDVSSAAASERSDAEALGGLVGRRWEPEALANCDRNGGFHFAGLRPGLKRLLITARFGNVVHCRSVLVLVSPSDSTWLEFELRDPVGDSSPSAPVNLGRSQARNLRPNSRFASAQTSATLPFHPPDPAPDPTPLGRSREIAVRTGVVDEMGAPLPLGLFFGMRPPPTTWMTIGVRRGGGGQSAGFGFEADLGTTIRLVVDRDCEVSLGALSGSQWDLGGGTPAAVGSGHRPASTPDRARGLQRPLEVRVSPGSPGSSGDVRLDFLAGASADLTLSPQELRRSALTDAQN